VKTDGILAKVNRAQRTLLFKVIASAAVVALALSFVINYAVQQRAQQKASGTRVEIVARPSDAPAPGDAATIARKEAARADAEADAQYINDLLSRQVDWTGAAVVAGLVCVLAFAFIWLGLGAIAPVLLGLIALAAWRLRLFSPQDVGFEELKTLDVVLLFVAAAAVLTSSFLVLMELLKMCFSPSRPVMAVARNVVAEAVRLRVSLVLIVLLIFGLAALPGLLEPGTPLRYRVQSFLEYGTGGSFWVIAVLVLFLSVGSVTFEQRDRIIWQTMTKPVAAWEYLLGKWLGVCGVAAVLLMVSGSGVFAFTEYLSRQKAVGEVRPYVAQGAQFIAEDRAILETQVLASRRTIYPRTPDPVEQEVRQEIDRRIEEELRQAGIGVTPESVAEYRTPEREAELRKEILAQLRDAFLSIEAGKQQEYEFTGLKGVRRTSWESVESAAERRNLSVDEVTALVSQGRLLSRERGGRTEIGRVSVRPLTLRYKVQAGGNDPRTVFKVSFSLPGQGGAIVREAPLNTMMTLAIPPSAIDEDGALRVKVYNGDINTNTPNESTMALPTDGFQLYFASGSYRANFLRVVLVLWMKLAFLAAVAITASTFLSFPVAAMISFGVLLIAEGASFVWEALNYYDAEVDGKLVLYRLVIRLISLPIAWTFKHYSEITPVQSLANGTLVPWTTVLWAVILLGGTSVLLYLAGVAIFRRRELATYSGQ
jgi:hypothetical protein